MTRQRFNGLRLELCRRINVKMQGKFTGKQQQELRDLRPDFKVVHSYKEAWEVWLKPARDCVGM